MSRLDDILDAIGDELRRRACEIEELSALSAVTVNVNMTHQGRIDSVHSSVDSKRRLERDITVVQHK